MSTTMPPAATAWKTCEQLPGLIRQVEDRDTALIRRQQHVADHDVFHAGQLLGQGGEVAVARSVGSVREALDTRRPSGPAGLPAPGRGSRQAERLMHRSQRPHAVGAVDQHGNLDVRRS